MIGDMEQCDEKTFISLIKGLKRTAFFIGLHHLRYQCSKDAFHEKYFLKYGIRLDKTYPIGGVNFTNVFPLNRLKFTMADNDGY